MNKKVVVCRRFTERQEGIVSGHLLLCKSPEILPEIIRGLICDNKIFVDCPFGDGNSGSRVSKILIDYLSKSGDD